MKEKGQILFTGTIKLLPSNWQPKCLEGFPADHDCGLVACQQHNLPSGYLVRLRESVAEKGERCPRCGGPAAPCMDFAASYYGPKATLIEGEFTTGRAVITPWRCNNPKSITQPERGE